MQPLNPFYFFYDFYILILKKKKILKIILIYFYMRSNFKKFHALNYQMPTELKFYQLCYFNIKKKPLDLDQYMFSENIFLCVLTN